MTYKKRLNLGCGNDIREGWVNADLFELPGVDTVMDIEDVPWPFDGGLFGLVEAKDILEHVDHLVPVMEELHRILAPGGEARITVPHFSSRGAHLDPTHRRAFSVESFRYFAAGHQRSYYSAARFEIGREFISFDKSLWLPWNFILERLVNLGSRWRRLYEMTPLSVFRALNVEVTLIKR